MKYGFDIDAAFGVAGNFTGHLEQAGEDKVFTKIQTAEAGAPKALFPTYIKPQGANMQNKATPDFLHVFPFDNDTINFPAGEQKLQIEPECAVLFTAEWQQDKIVSLKPVMFGASNDCSIRKEGAKKISVKKNWGKCTKGISSNFIELDSFDAKSNLADYRIASFLVRDGNVYPYGEDSAVRDYSYIWEKLLNWCIDKLNNQQDVGPAEDIHSYLVENGKPQNILISIGATRYTDFGEHNFLQNGDKAVVVLYPESKYQGKKITDMVAGMDFSDSSISVLCQTVIL